MTVRTPYVDGGVYYFPMDLCYQDTDMAGVVYHSRYLDLAERARGSLLRSLGIPLDVHKTFRFAAHSCHITYHRPLFVDDALWITTTMDSPTVARLAFTHRFLVGMNTCASLSITVVAVDSSGKVRKLDSAFLSRVQDFLALA